MPSAIREPEGERSGSRPPTVVQLFLTPTVHGRGFVGEDRATTTQTKPEATAKMLGMELDRHLSPDQPAKSHPAATLQPTA